MPARLASHPRAASLALAAGLFALGAWPAPALARPRPSKSKPPAPAFVLLPLGVRGGGSEGNLSAYALRAAARPGYHLLVDGGGLGEGIARYLGSDDFAGLERFALGLDDMLLTHSHLDHLGGLMVWTQHLLARTTPARIHASAATVGAVRTHLLQSPVWADFEKLGKIALEPFEAGETRTLAGFTVRPVPLTHTVPCQGYLVETPDGAAFAHLGDTGPTTADVPVLGPVLAAGRLRALSIECSFNSSEETLAIRTGHLTPALLVRHLLALAGAAPGGGGPRLGPDLAAAAALVKDPAAKAAGSPATPEEVEAAAKAFHGVRIFVQHVKPAYLGKIGAELREYARHGLRLELLRQAVEVEF